MRIVHTHTHTHTHTDVYIYIYIYIYIGIRILIAILQLYELIPTKCTVFIVILKLKTYLQFVTVINTPISCNSL
jgi:hypothetical protein